MAVIKHYRTRVRQKGGSQKVTKSKLVDAGLKATKGKSVKSKLFRGVKTVIDPRKLASAGVGLARGAYSGILGATRVAATSAAQLGKFGIQSAKVASAQAKLGNTLKQVTGYNQKALNSYEAARQKVATLEADYKTKVLQGVNAVTRQRLEQELESATDIRGDYLRAFSNQSRNSFSKLGVYNKVFNLSGPQKSRTEIQQALANAVADKQRTAQTGLAESQKKLQKLLEGQNIGALRQLAQQDTSKLDTSQLDYAAKKQQIENAQKQVNAINTAATKIRTKTEELARLGVKENTSIGARVKSLVTGKTSLTKGVANFRNSLRRRQNRVAVTGQSLERTGSKLVDVVRNSVVAAKKGYEASKKAVGVGEGFTGLAKSLYRVPASLIGQSLSTLGKEAGKIKFTGPSGATVYASNVGRKLLQTAQQLYSGQEKSTAIILSQIETENQNVEKTRTNLAKNAGTLDKDINAVRDKYKNPEQGTNETPDQKEFREKQGKLVNNALVTVDAYRTAIKNQQEAKQKLRNLELQLSSASSVVAVELQNKIRTEKEKIIQESAKASKQQAALGSLVSSLGSDTSSAAQEIKAIADTTNNYYSGVKKLNESEQLLQTSAKKVALSFQNELALINKFNATDITSIAENTKIDASLLNTNPTGDNVNQYLNASNSIDTQLKIAKDPAKIEQLKNAKNIIVARINMASALAYIPALGQTANPVPAATSETPVAAVPAPATAPGPVTATTERIQSARLSRAKKEEQLAAAYEAKKAKLPEAAKKLYNILNSKNLSDYENAILGLQLAKYTDNFDKLNDEQKQAILQEIYTKIPNLKELLAQKSAASAAGPVQGAVNPTQNPAVEPASVQGEKAEQVKAEVPVVVPVVEPKVAAALGPAEQSAAALGPAEQSAAPVRGELKAAIQTGAVQGASQETAKGALEAASSETTALGQLAPASGASEAAAAVPAPAPAGQASPAVQAPKELKPNVGASPGQESGQESPVADPKAAVQGAASTEVVVPKALETTAAGQVPANLKNLTPAEMAQLFEVPEIVFTPGASVISAPEDIYVEVTSKQDGGGSRKLNKIQKKSKKSKKARVSKNKLHKRKSRKNTN